MSDAELLSILPAALGRPVASLARRPLPQRSSFAIDRVDVEFGDGAQATYVCKAVATRDLDPEGAAAKPAFVLDPRREAAVYRDVLAPARVDVPRLHVSVCDPAAGRHWLLLEHVDGVPLWQLGERRAWEDAAAWLGELHARAAAPADAHLLAYDAAFLRTWLRRAVAFAPPGTLERVRAGYDAVLQRLLAWPATLVHGDFFASNVLVERSGRIRVVDWELAGRGPGLLDLAALTAGTWTERERGRLVRAYGRGLRTGGEDVATAELVAALPAFRLQVALQRIGWSACWTPPAEHANDWLGEALQAADELGL